MGVPFVGLTGGLGAGKSTALAALERTNAADVQRVAKKYLGHDQSTTGWFVPVETK